MLQNGYSSRKYNMYTLQLPDDQVVLPADHSHTRRGIGLDGEKTWRLSVTSFDLSKLALLDDIRR
jgi:hypothetical protein